MKYRYFGVKNSKGEFAYVSGQVYFNGNISTKTLYDDILWLVTDNDREALHSEALKDRYVLVIYESEFLSQRELRRKLGR